MLCIKSIGSCSSVRPFFKFSLILDDFGMKKLEGQQQNDFEQIIDDRYNRKSIIIVSQLPIADWYNVINNELIAEACLDRIVHKAVRFELKGDSLRKKY
jgi:DNA replication protein DnaC